MPLNRKNALFAGHNVGGVVWDRIGSLIETAKMNRVEPIPVQRCTPCRRLQTADFMARASSEWEIC